MTRTAAATASALTELYQETFKNDSFEPFSITWPQLRAVAGVTRLSDCYLEQINSTLNESDYLLVPMSDLLLVAQEQDLSRFRAVPDRLVETFVYDGDDDDDDDDEDEEIEGIDFGDADDDDEFVEEVAGDETAADEEQRGK